MNLTPSPPGVPSTLGGSRGNFTQDRAADSGGGAPPSDPPTLTDVYPNYGSIDGGTPLTLTGTNFSSPAVTLGGVACTDVVAVNSTTITCVTPVGVTYGPKDVVIANGGGNATLTGCFSYDRPAIATGVAPSSGATFGGYRLALSGAANSLADVSAVTVGGAACDQLYAGVSATVVAWRAPAGTAGTKDVVVTRRNGETLTLAGAFTYAAPSPTITSVLPAGGATAGGTPLTITGTDFAPTITSVTIDGNACTSVVRVSQTRITCVTPAGTSGSKTLTVTNSDGSSASSAYAYSDTQIYVGSISPVGGPLAGGTAVTVRGSNFVSDPTVTVGGAAATSVVFVDAQTLTCVAPSRTAGAKDVVVTNPDTSAATLTAGYNYAAAPTIGGSQTGPVVGGRAYSISGSNLQDGAILTLDGVAPAYNERVSSAVRMISDAATAGVKTFVVTNPDGQVNATARTFTYQDNPFYTTVFPSSSPNAGGQTASLYGFQFQNGATVTIGGVSATNVVWRSANLITCVVPAGSGSPSLVITNPDTLTATSNYSYAATSPTVTSLNVTTGPAAGGTAVTVTGTNFIVPSTIVLVGGVRATSVVVVNTTTITCVTPAGTVGAKDVAAQNSTTLSGTLTNGFTYT